MPTEADFPRALPEIRPFLAKFPGFPSLLNGGHLKVREIMASGPLPKLDESKVEREDVVIKGAGGQDMRLLVTRPKGKRENVPVILAFHAGGFVLGFPELDLDLYAHWSINGFVVVSPDYRLAPEHVYPSAIEDAASAFDYLVSSEGVAKLGIDTSRIAFFGQSAGSCLATGLSIALKKKASKVMPKIVALDSSFLDYRLQYPCEQDDFHLTPYFFWTSSLTRDANELYFGGPSPKASELVFNAFPLATASDEDLKGLPTHYVSSCELDNLAEHGLLYAHRLFLAGVPTEVHMWRGVPHAFISTNPQTEVAMAAKGEYVRVFREAME